jgi:hypothetical protein
MTTPSSAESASAELPLVAFRAVDNYLVVDGQPSRPAALESVASAPTLAALELEWAEWSLAGRRIRFPL